MCFDAYSKGAGDKAGSPAAWAFDCGLGSGVGWGCARAARAARQAKAALSVVGSNLGSESALPDMSESSTWPLVELGPAGSDVKAAASGGSRAASPPAFPDSW